VHSGIEGDNILITSKEDALLGSFGRARLGIQTADDDDSADHSAGQVAYPTSLRFLSPELLEDQALPTPASDVWAFAMLISQLYSGRPPFSEFKQNARVAVAVIRGDKPVRPENCPIRVWSVAIKCLEQDPEDRPTMVQVHADLVSLLSETASLT